MQINSFSAGFSVSGVARPAKAADPQGPPPDPSLTLGAALERYLERCRSKARSKATIQHYSRMIRLHGSDWLGRTLEDLGRSRAEVATRHVQLTTEVGPNSANHFIQTFRAI